MLIAALQIHDVLLQYEWRSLQRTSLDAQSLADGIHCLLIAWGHEIWETIFISPLLAHMQGRSEGDSPIYSCASTNSCACHQIHCCTTSKHEYCMRLPAFQTEEFPSPLLLQEARVICIALLRSDTREITYNNQRLLCLHLANMPACKQYSGQFATLNYYKHSRILSKNVGTHEWM